ncbi:hypothetical protein [Nocardia thailandica]|uniref:hypothetical protein n=1 Tax=Nocardia thailandica TaxID=257275 RepID=UPI0003159D74|nr:hypothetical protein [Nocardia thailandica]
MTLSPDPGPKISPFHPIPLHPDLSDGVADLGVTTHPPDRVAAYWFSDDGQMWKEIGHLTVESDGGVGVWPRDHDGPGGVTDDELEVLCQLGVEAFVHRPSAQDAWIQTPDGTWHTEISVPVDDGDPFAERVRAIEITRRAQRAAA